MFLSVSGIEINPGHIFVFEANQQSLLLGAFVSRCEGFPVNVMSNINSHILSTNHACTYAHIKNHTHGRLSDIYCTLHLLNLHTLLNLNDF